MNPQNTQIDLSPDEAKASLGVATHLMDQLMPREQQQPESSQEQAQNEQPTQSQEDTVTPRVDELEGKFGDLEKEVKKTIKDELGGIKDMIQELIKEDNGKQE